MSENNNLIEADNSSKEKDKKDFMETGSESMESIDDNDVDNKVGEIREGHVQDGVSLMDNYIKNARKFTVMGLCGVLIGLVCVLAIRKQNDPLMIISSIVMFGGALIAVTGISSLRAEGMLRTFAQLAAMQPTTAAIKDLRDAIKRCKMIGVRKQVKFQVESAVAKYEKLEGADLELAEEVRKAGENLRVKRLI